MGKFTLLMLTLAHSNKMSTINWKLNVYYKVIIIIIIIIIIGPMAYRSERDGNKAVISKFMPYGYQ